MNKFKFPKEIKDILDAHGTIIITSENNMYKYLPYWFKSREEDDIFEMYPLNEPLPDDLVDFLKRNREEKSKWTASQPKPLTMEYLRQYPLTITEAFHATDSLFSRLPENMPLYKDSGLWQMRSDDMEDVWVQQRVNESEAEFLKRCIEWDFQNSGGNLKSE